MNNPPEQSWKEELRKYAADNLNDGEYPIPESGRMVQLEYAVETLIDGVSKLVEKIIEEIPEFAGQATNVKKFKQSLRDKYLN